MYPVLPFAIGAMVGAAAVRLLKTVNLRGSLDKAQERLRDATISSLDAIEHSSAGLKAKLAAPDASPPAAAAPAEAKAEAAPARKAPARRRSSPASGAAKPATAAKTATAPKPAAAPKTAKPAEAAAARPRTRKKAAVPPADTGDSA